MARMLVGLILVFAISGCIEDVQPQVLTRAEAELGKDDSLPRLVGRGFRLGVQPAVQARDDGSGWFIKGASNQRLSDLSAQIEGAEVAVTLTDQSFVVQLDEVAVEALVVGIPLDIIATSNEDIAFLRVAFAMRWTDRRTSHKLTIEPELDPVMLPGGVVAIRAFATTPDGLRIESVFTDDDQEPIVYQDFDGKWELDWRRQQVPMLMDFADDRVYFNVVDHDDTRYQASAKLRLRATEQSWSRSEFSDDFACTSAVRFCLHHVVSTERDASECGRVADMLACFRVEAN